MVPGPVVVVMRENLLFVGIAGGSRRAVVESRVEVVGGDTEGGQGQGLYRSTGPSRAGFMYLL
jgi:hypothetical protein